MKKLFTLFLFAMFLLAMPVLALAEEAPVEPYTWEYLGTIAGAAAFTLLVVQFFKAPLDKVWKIPTRVFVYVIALATMLVATAFTSGLTIEKGILAAVNALLAALTAMGAYEITFAKTEPKPPENVKQ